jgi:hypothetical protein
MVMVRKSSRCMLPHEAVLKRAPARKVDMSPRRISATTSQMSVLSVLTRARRGRPEVCAAAVAAIAVDRSKVVVGGQGAQTAGRRRGRTDESERSQLGRSLDRCKTIDNQRAPLRCRCASI